MKNSAFSPLSELWYFVWLAEQTASTSMYKIERLRFITGRESVYCAVWTEHVCACLEYGWIKRRGAFPTQKRKTKLYECISINSYRGTDQQTVDFSSSEFYLR
jgi:hypothetical protein